MSVPVYTRSELVEMIASNTDGSHASALESDLIRLLSAVLGQKAEMAVGLEMQFITGRPLNSWRAPISVFKRLAGRWSAVCVFSVEDGSRSAAVELSADAILRTSGLQLCKLEPRHFQPIPPNLLHGFRPPYVSTSAFRRAVKAVFHSDNQVPWFAE